MEEKILLSCFDLLKKKGLHFTMDDLTHELHISKSTLYKYFQSRDALIESLVDYFLNIMDEEEREIYESDCSLEEKVIAAVRAYSIQHGRFDNCVYQNLYRRPAIHEKMNAFNRRRFDRLNDIFDEGQKKGWIIEDFNRPLFFKVLMIAQTGLMEAKELTDLNMTYSDAVVDTIRLYLHGIVKKREV